MPSRNKHRYRRSPYLVCHWDSDQLIVQNYATGVKAVAAPLILKILDFFDDWQSVDALATRLEHDDPGGLRKAIDALVGYTLLDRFDRRSTTQASAFRDWATWMPEAAFFHFATKDVTYHHPQDAEILRRTDTPARPAPPPSKRTHGVERLRLDSNVSTDEFSRVLLNRRTWRRFGRRPIKRAELETLLEVTWGVQQWVPLEGYGQMALKTSPSGGARHCVEAYVLALRVEGLPRGLYHYESDAHDLERLRSGARRAEVARYLPTQDWYGDAAAVFFMTAVFSRVQWRYQFPRAYRVVLLEAGHLCQTFCLTATWLGLAPFCSAALADSKIEQELGIDGVKESVLYVAGVGSRPHGVDWAPWPETPETPQRLPPRHRRRRRPRADQK